MTRNHGVTFVLIGQSGLLDLCTEKILRRGHKVAALIRQDSRTNPSIPSMRSLAEAKEKLREPPDILLSVINHQVLTKEDLGYARMASINYHDSALPKYAGLNATSWAILNGETQHGISWHLMTPEIDTGDLVCQRKFEIEANETAISLSRKCFYHAVDGFEELLKHIEMNRLIRSPQDLNHRTYYGRGDRLPCGGLINWRDSAEKISRFVRSADWGEQDNEFGTAKILLPNHLCLRVGNAVPLQIYEDQEPGVVVSQDADAFTLIAGDQQLIRLTGLKDLDVRSRVILEISPGSKLPELTSLQLKAVQSASTHATHEEARHRKLLGSCPAPLNPKNLRQFKFSVGQDYYFRTGTASDSSLGNAVAPVIARLIDDDTNLPFLIGIAATPLPGFHHILPCIISSAEINVIANSIDRAHQGALCPKDLPLRFKTIAKTWGRLETVRVIISDHPDYQITNNGMLIIHNEEGLLIQLSSSQISAEDAQYWAAYLLKGNRWKEVMDTLDSKTEDTIVSRILEHAYSRPDSLAVKSGHSSITYAALERRSSQLASTLLAAGASNEARVAVFLPQSVDFPIACLAILRSGAAFIPLDVSTPLARLERIVLDARPLAIITNHAHLDLAGRLSCPVINIESFQISSIDDCHRKTPKYDPNDLAYVVYTSGSSGEPKGCMIERGSLHHYIKTVVERYQFTPSDRILQLCSLGFDAAIDEVFSALYAGATLVVKPDDMLQTCQHFLEICDHEQLTVIGIYPSIISDFINAMNNRCAFPASVRLVTTGGEQVRLKDVEAWHSFFEHRKQKPPKFVNNYGLSETTIINLSADLTKQSVVDGFVPIGRPLPGNECLIVDEDMNSLAAGRRGELLLSGKQIGRAYWNQQDLNLRKFIIDPSTQKRWFRTGDLAQISHDGIITCHGRIDRQIQLRGVRIELEEIENVLTSMTGISRAACILHTPKNKREVLVAFVSPRVDNSNRVLQQELQARLPTSMQPQQIITLADLPLTERGKIDYRALSSLLEDNETQPRASHEDLSQPVSAVEKELHAIWAEVLGHAHFGVNESFFEVGGDSITSMMLIQLVEKRFKRCLMLSTLFANPTVGQLSAWIEGRVTLPRAEFQSLVCLQNSGDGQPLYVIHGGDGSVYVHLQLARAIGSHCPVYGLQAIGFDGSDSPQSSVEQMAAHYASEMLCFQPKGPYHLLGYSAGGWYAWAVATELRKRGAEIGSIVLIDTGPTADLHRRLRIQQLLRRQLMLLPARIGAIRTRGSQKALSHLEQKWVNLRFILWTIFRDRSSGLPGDVDIGKPRLPTQPLRGDYFIQLHTYYRPSRQPIRVDVLSTIQQSDANRRLWNFYTMGRAVIHPCMQEHEDFYDEQKVKCLASQLQEILAANQASIPGDS